MTRQHRRRLEWETSQKQAQAPAEPTEDQAKGIPGGPQALRAILSLKGPLHTELETVLRSFTITVEYLHEEWCFMVRSPRKPPSHWFAGYKVYWLRSHTASPVQ